MDVKDLIEKKKEIDGQLDELRGILGAQTVGKTGYERFLGENVFIRTVTHHYCGKCVETTGMVVVLDNASWVADDGRFHEAMESGEYNEVEPYPAPIVVSLAAILDATTVPSLPDGVK